MNLLIVDDQSSVVNSLRQQLDFKKIGIDEVYTAFSSREAKLVLSGFPVDILITDIEMPEEDGLMLFRWTIERNPGIVGIFLTSHADFQYAREALKMGGFDYILQPARLEEVEAALKRAVDECRKKQQEQRLQNAVIYMNNQRDAVLELLLINEREGNTAECEKLFKSLSGMFEAEIEHCVFYRAEVHLVQFDKKKNAWDADLVKLVFKNVLEELLEDYHVNVLPAKRNFDSFCLMTAAEDQMVPEDRWEAAITEFTAFFNSHMDFKVAVYPLRGPVRVYMPYTKSGMEDITPGIYWETDEDTDLLSDGAAERVKKAEAYIRDNLYRSITRTEVAEYLHINEDYFTRIFKKYTGCTFKEYDSRIHMETAKTLLEQTRLPVSIIATKVGFDNFSHFSKAFKKYTGKTPSEYRSGTE